MVLDVSGMKCGGCSAAVKRILLQQPGVHAAAVNLLTETAVVQVAAAAATTRMDVPSPPPPQALAATAAEALTAKGFPSRLRSSEEGLAEDAATLSQRKEEELRKRCGGDGGGGGGAGSRGRRCVIVSLPSYLLRACSYVGTSPPAGSPPFPCSSRDLAFAWGLALVCQPPACRLTTAVGQRADVPNNPTAIEGASNAAVCAPSACPLLHPADFMHALGNPWVSGGLGAAALLGPGRQLLVDGTLSLFR